MIIFQIAQISIYLCTVSGNLSYKLPYYKFDTKLYEIDSAQRHLKPQSSLRKVSPFRGSQFMQGRFGGVWAEQDASCLLACRGRWTGPASLGDRGLMQSHTLCSSVSWYLTLLSTFWNSYLKETDFQASFSSLVYLILGESVTFINWFTFKLPLRNVYYPTAQ